MSSLRRHLEAGRGGGRKLFVPYLMVGVPDQEAFARALSQIAPSADAVELGIPYSDPLMDGPVIAAAAERAIASGVGPAAALEIAARLPDAPPRVAMTYYNPIHRVGEKEFCRRAAAAGIAGLIVPDLPLEESEGLRRAAAVHHLAWVPLVAPTTADGRVARIAATATGFIYAVSTLGVTGERRALGEAAARVARRCREASDAPVLIGIGVSTPEHAVEAASAADGVVVGSVLVRLLAEKGAGAAGRLAAAMREALDGGEEKVPRGLSAGNPRR